MAMEMSNSQDKKKGETSDVKITLSPEQHHWIAKFLLQMLVRVFFASSPVLSDIIFPHLTNSIWQKE